MKTIRNHLFPLSILLAGCSPQVGEPAPPPQTDAAAWTVTETAIGPFNAGTEFDSASVAALVPEYSIETGTRSREGEDYPTLLLFREGGSSPSVELVDGNPSGTISEVIIYEAGRVADPRADIGTRFAESGFTPDDCWPGMEAWSGLVVCYAPDQPQFGYWFNPAPYAGPDGELPPVEILEDARVTMLRWWQPAGE